MSILRLDTAKSEKFICGMFFIFTQLNYCYFISETIDFISFFQHSTLQNSPWRHKKKNPAEKEMAKKSVSTSNFSSLTKSIMGKFLPIMLPKSITFPGALLPIGTKNFLLLMQNLME
jgi:hypothetical protein